MIPILAIAAICLAPPVNGPISAGYSPVGSYGGHWGVDFGVAVGTPVRAPTSGRVTFAGSVAGMRSVTIEPVPGLKVSVSYLATIETEAGEWVRRGAVVGTAGSPHRVAGLHLSTRVDGRYVDPESLLTCRPTDITRALRLVTPPQPYPRRRAHRDTRRDIRPDPHRPSPRRGVRPASGGSRSGPVRSRR